MFFLLGVFGVPPVEAASLPPFQVGEKLTYHFYWGIFMVGRGVFEVKEVNKDGHHVFTVQAQSNEVISLLYPVDAVFHSFFDFQHLRSVHFEQNRSEKRTHIWEETFFYYQWGLGSTESYVTGEKKWFEIPKDRAQDKLSTIYYMRCLDWGNRVEASALMGNDKRNYPVVMTKVGTEILTTDDFRPISTFQVMPNMEYLSGFVKKGTMTVWVSDDEFKIPVQVKAKLSIGTVSASLVKVEGIKGWPYGLKD